MVAQLGTILYTCTTCTSPASPPLAPTSVCPWDHPPAFVVLLQWSGWWGEVHAAEFSPALEILLQLHSSFKISRSEDAHK